MPFGYILCAIIWFQMNQCKAEPLSIGLHQFDSRPKRGPDRPRELPSTYG